jgi:hypothetical protein
VHALASAMWTNYFRLFDVGDVVLLGEFLLAIFAMKNVLRHVSTPANMIAPTGVDRLRISVKNG